LERLEWSGVEGVGFYRTDGLFLREGAGFASEEEQLGIYGRVFELAGGRAVVVRTADLRSGEFGGDGSLAWEYLSGLSERFYQSHPEAFVTQVRAVLRAAAGNHRVRLIVPKIETLDQWRLVRGLVEEARGSLERQGQEFQKDFLHGLVVETLAAAWRFRQFLEAVDFVSVDTNNLVRYLFAVEQEEGKVEDMYQPEHPIVLKVLGRLAEEANAAGRWFCMSGAMAADPGLLGVLVGMGVEHLSVAIAAVEAVRERLRQLDQDECRDLAGACREAKTAEQVRKILGRPGAKGGGF
jgi:phosphoenolpyruvate-protein kinase (PTS system EI component)